MHSAFCKSFDVHIQTLTMCSVREIIIKVMCFLQADISVIWQHDACWYSLFVNAFIEKHHITHFGLPESSVGYFINNNWAQLHQVDIRTQACSVIHFWYNTFGYINNLMPPQYLWLVSLNWNKHSLIIAKYRVVHVVCRKEQLQRSVVNFNGSTDNYELWIVHALRLRRCS